MVNNGRNKDTEYQQEYDKRGQGVLMMPGQEFRLDLQLFEALHLHLHTYLPLIPPGISLAWLTSVLDVGCGLHLWGRDLFRVMLEQGGHDLVADVRIEGIDNHPDMVRVANQQMRSGRGRVAALPGDMFHMPADFSGRYDLVHARFLSPFVAPHAWPALLEELVRVCKPGGWVVWCEPALPTKGEQTSAWNQWLDWIEQAIAQMGGSPQIAMSMQDLFRQIDSLQEIEIQKTAIPLQKTAVRQGFLTAEQVHTLHGRLLAFHSYLQAAGVASPRLLARGLQQVEEEFNMRTIASRWEWYTLSGRKF